ncbi:MAG: hypothetical protein WCU00_04090 [Candidatus Latescibacterota bacterium]
MYAVRHIRVPALIISALFLLSTPSTGENLPVGISKPALDLSYFPSRLHAFVWRNWESVPVERMAEVLDTTSENVREIGKSLGLPPQGKISEDFQSRGYISLIRRNWHILPYDQLLKLLGWDDEKLAFTLREDDFLWVKLGGLKPDCPTLSYAKPDGAAEKRCAEIRNIITRHFGKELYQPAVPRFEFLHELAAPDTTSIISVPVPENAPIRYLYSYFAVYGDPLLHPELDPYPDGLLSRLSRLGVNGVWLHTVLRQLAPGELFPDESAADADIRITNLRKLVERAGRYGIRVYLYMNEPRAMPESFFKGKENLKGGKEGDFYALCTSVPEVREWITGGLRHLFGSVPGLGGVFTISASENFTTCWSHGNNASGCPRCSLRPMSDVIAEGNAAIARGVHEGNPDAKVIAWDWGWPDDQAEKIISKLPGDVFLMSVSEWSLPITRGGISSTVGEYSISAGATGPRAKKNWETAKKHNLGVFAKMQANTSWELSAVPYLPVMRTIATHFRSLASAGVENYMLSWTVGGYPSPNFEIVRRISAHPTPDIETVLSDVASSRYGKKAAPDAVRAWNKFSEAFAEYPFHAQFVYNGPIQYGPANPLWPEPTGYVSTMVGFPYDDIDGWRAVYPADVLAGQFEKLATLWGDGLRDFRTVLKKTTGEGNSNARADLGIAEAACLHFQSVANQVRFTTARNEMKTGSLSPAESAESITVIRRAAEDEIRTARRLFTLCREDSRIGYEASNHYYYLPLDLVEKVIDCEYILTTWKQEKTK